MIARPVDQMLRLRLAVCALVLLATAASLYAIRAAPLDAIPDISDPEINVSAK